MADHRWMLELDRQRTLECRLTPEGALGSLDDAGTFLADRGMLTRMPDCALPSLFGACHEEPSRAGGKGFDLWPKTRWIWSFQLSRQPGALLTKLHKGKSLYLSMDTAMVFDPLVRGAIAAAVGDEATLLEHLAAHGPSTSEDIEVELGWDRTRLKRARNRLERLGAVISDGLVFHDSADWSFAPMRRWDHVVPREVAPSDPCLEIAAAGVRAAVVAREAEISSWFSFRIPQGALDQLVTAGRVIRPAPGYIAIADRAQ